MKHRRFYICVTPTLKVREEKIDTSAREPIEANMFAPPDAGSATRSRGSRDGGAVGSRLGSLGGAVGGRFMVRAIPWYRVI